MRDYDRTLWENNKTVVDADKLNNVEDQLQVLTINSVDNNSRIAEIEATLPMKANKDHSHKEYSLKEHTHEDFTTNEEFDTIKGDVQALSHNFEILKQNLSNEFKKYFDDASIDENDMLNLYSNGVLLRSLQLPKGQGPAMSAICGDFLSGDLVAGQNLSGTRNEFSYLPTIWQDGVTPVNAENLNKIEAQLIELSSLIGEAGNCIHTGAIAPADTSMLWIDTEDETTDENEEDTLIELFAKTLQDHKDKIAELFYLTDAYLDDGLFEDEGSEEQILDGGIF